jgi:hypothetical protein
MNKPEPLKFRPLPAFTGYAAKVHDFGSYGKMTVLEAVKVSGRHESTIYRRLKLGYVGDALLAPYTGKPPRDATRVDLNFTTNTSLTFHQGVLMHKLYGDNPPTCKVLMKDFGYTRATAYRRLQAYRDALGVS